MGIWALAATHSTLYVGAEGGDGITALHVSNGSRLWNYPTQWRDVIGNIVEQFVISDRTLYVRAFFSNSSSILALNMQNGSVRWQDSSCDAPPGATPETRPAGSLPGPLDAAIGKAGQGHRSWPH